MARACLKCGNHIPKHLWVYGKKVSCQRRKYCFDCSPFGEHNTKKLERTNEVNGQKICPSCKEFHAQNSLKCFKCYFNDRKVFVSKIVESLVGNKCWICDYNKTKKSLCFHHVDPSSKLFCLTTRELMLKWERVWKEMRKCVLICMNCHGEIHAGVINVSAVLEIWKNRWENILKSVDQKTILTQTSKHKFITKQCKYCNNDFEIHKHHYDSTYCSVQCCQLSTRRCIRPDKDTLQKLIEENSWVAIGRMFLVTDNAVRKWARQYGLLNTP